MMLTTKAKTIKTTKDSVEGVKEVTTIQAIGPNEPLDEVPERLDEVEAIVDELIAHDEKFKSLDIYQQAEYLEMGFIFGKFANSQHFQRDDFLVLLRAKRDGVVQDLKDKAAQKAQEREGKPVDGKAKDLG